MPDRSLEKSNLTVPNSASSRAAKALAIGSQTNLTADLTPEARAQRCALAVDWLNERVRKAGVLSQEQLAALATARQHFHDQASTGKRAGNTPTEVDDRTMASPAETLQTAFECLRQLPAAI